MMPFSDETYDFVICTSAFKNFQEPIKVLDEIFRVLKTSGKSVVIDMNKDIPKERRNKFVNHMKLNMFDSFFTKQTFKKLAKSAYTQSEITDLVKKSRFKQCKIVDENIGFEIWLDKTRVTFKE